MTIAINHNFKKSTSFFNVIQRLWKSPEPEHYLFYHETESILGILKSHIFVLCIHIDKRLIMLNYKMLTENFILGNPTVMKLAYSDMMMRLLSSIIYQQVVILAELKWILLTNM